VLELVSVEGDEVNETVIFTDVERAGTVKRYHTSRLLPHVLVPVTVVDAELYRVPAVKEQSAPTVNVMASVQALLPG